MTTEEIESLKEHIKAHVLEVSTHYAGGVVRRDGRRFIFRCPRCGKDTLHTYPEWISGPITGCWNGSCSIARTLDALALIAEMENLDNDRQFMSVLEQGSRITGGHFAGAQNGSTEKSPANAPPNHPTTANSTTLLSDEEPQPEEDPQLTHNVYNRLLSMCALSPEVWEGLQNRGLQKDTILDAGITYLTSAKGPKIVSALADEFGDDLVRVPGFYKSEQAKAGYWSNFAGKELILFPYYDGQGLLTTIEGRVMFGKEHTTKYKYLSFTGSGSHAYVFPGMGFENIEAFCEGLMGAIVAAQEGICVASIQGFRRYRATGGRYPLPELAGVDFAGRVVVYIPDMDLPPKPDVAEAAPDAARWLIERQNGQPQITLLPSGKDLDEFLLAMQAQHRRLAFDTLLKNFSRTPVVYEKELAEGSLNTEAPPADGQLAEYASTQTGAGNQRADTGHSPQTEEDTPETRHPANSGDEEHSVADPTAEDAVDEVLDEGAGDQAAAPDATADIDSSAPASSLAGEQFYKEGFEYPPEPPDPYTAIFGKEGHQQTHAPDSEDERGRLQRIKESLRGFRDSLASSTWSLLKRGAAAALELFVVCAVIYVSLILVLEVLTPLGAFAGMWKAIAVAVVLCALLRARLARRRRRFLTGILVPGKK